MNLERPYLEPRTSAPVSDDTLLLDGPSAGTRSLPASYFAPSSGIALTALATQANNTVLLNISGGAAVPIAGTGSNVRTICGLAPTDTPTFAGLTLTNLAALTTPSESWVGPSSTAGVYFKGGNVGIGTNAPSSALDIRGTLTAFGNTNSANIGKGAAAGAPTGTITTVATVGGLTGTYKYTYNEQDSVGNTLLSPVTTVVANSNQYLVTVPLMRRGISGRTLWRTKANGSTYYQLHVFADGHYTDFQDNTADGSLTVAFSQVADTTLIYNLSVNEGVKFFRTHPDQGTIPADITLLTGDPATPGAWALDSYQTISAKAGGLGQSFYARAFGPSANYFIGQYVPVLDNGTAAVTNILIKASGEIDTVTQHLITVNGGNAFVTQATSGSTLGGIYNNAEPYFGGNINYSSGDTYSKTGLPAFRIGNSLAGGATAFTIDIAPAGTVGNPITWANNLIVNNLGNWTLAPSAAATGHPTLFTLTGPAHTNLDASTEAIDILFNLNRTVTWATGNITEQSAIDVRAPTYAFADTSTITLSSTLKITSAPVAGTHATQTIPMALWIPSGQTVLGGTPTTAPNSTHILRIWNTSGTAAYAVFESSNSNVVRVGMSASNQGTIGSSNNTPFLVETNGTTRTFWDTSGNVGIGNTAPSNTLTVGPTNGQSTAIISARASGNGLEFGHTNSAGYGSTLGANAGNGQPFIAFSAEAGTTSNTFRTRGLIGTVLSNTSASTGGLTVSNLPTASADNQTPTELFRITSGGNVGIGTTNPVALITVGNYGSSSTHPVILSQSWDNATGFANFVGGWTSPGWWGIGALDNTSDYTLFIGSIDSPNQATGTWSPNQHLNLAIPGNVGIGTTTPHSKLAIVGLPTSTAGLSSGDIWVDTTGGLNILKIV